jgi:MATE family multidrug resistance protein
VFANYVLLGWLLGRERPGAILIVTVFGNLANVALNLLFIVHFGWAARGAGLASMAGQYLALLLALALVASSRSADGERLFSRATMPSIESILEQASLRRFLALNRDIFIRTVCLIGSFALFTNISSTFGATALAANAILLRLLDLAAYLNDGAAYATESLAGSLAGSRKTDQLRRLLAHSLAFGQILAWLFIIPVLLIPELVLNLLTSHQDVITLARGSLLFLVPALFFGAFAYQYDGFFIGLTEGGVLRRSMLVSALVFFLPLALAAWQMESNLLLWSALVALNFARALTLWLASREWLRSFDTAGQEVQA